MALNKNIWSESFVKFGPIHDVLRDFPTMFKLEEYGGVELYFTDKEKNRLNFGVGDIGWMYQTKDSKNLIDEDELVTVTVPQLSPDEETTIYFEYRKVTPIRQIFNDVLYRLKIKVGKAHMPFEYTWWDDKNNN